MEKVLGIGGVFFKAKAPQSLAAWYREHLGVPVIPEQTYAPFEPSDDPAPTVWSIFPSDSEYLGRAESQFMINFRVSDLDAMLAQLKAANIEVDENTETYDYGKFGWATDPEGNRIELWEPIAPKES